MHAIIHLVFLAVFSYAVVQPMPQHFSALEGSLLVWIFVLLAEEIDQVQLREGWEVSCSFHFFVGGLNSSSCTAQQMLRLGTYRYFLQKWNILDLLAVSPRN